jgi:uncharacterized membrane protein YkgB
MNATRSSEESSADSMNTKSEPAISPKQGVGPQVEQVGVHVLRYGLALVVLWIGLMKFTAYEATGIQPLVASSPLLGWLYRILSVREFSAALGAVECAIAALIALRPWFPRASAVGSVAAVFMFLTTLSFLFSAPGWEPSLGGFPVLSSSVGQFLIKDVVLLGAAIWTCGEAYSANYTESRESNRISPVLMRRESTN